MSKAAETLNRNGFSDADVHVPDRVEDCESRTEDGGIFRSVDVLWDVDGSFSAENTVFGIFNEKTLAAHASEDLRQEMEDKIIFSEDSHPPAFVSPLTSWLSHIWGNPFLHAVQVPAHVRIEVRQ
jgi:hypothetical protein